MFLFNTAIRLNKKQPSRHLFFASAFVGKKIKGIFAGMRLWLMDKFVMMGGAMLVCALAVMLTACTPGTAHEYKEDDEVTGGSTQKQSEKLNIDSLAAVISARHPKFNEDDNEDIDDDEEYREDSDKELDDEEEDVYGFDYDMYPTVRRHATIGYYTMSGLANCYRTVDADVYIQGGKITKVDFPRGMGYPSGTHISSSQYDGAGHYRVYTYSGSYDVAMH